MSRASEAPLLVRLPNWLGDLVLAWPVVDAAARRGAVFAGPEPFRALVEPRYPGSPYVGISRSSRFAAAPSIRRLKPRAALLLTESLSSAILAWLSGVPERIGYAAEGRNLLLTRAVRRTGPARSMPRTREYAVLAEAAGLDVGPAIPRLAPLERELEAGKALLGRATRYAVVAPGASYGPAKQWGPERFASAAQDLTAHGLTIVLVGSREDAGVAKATIRPLVAAHTHDLTGATDLSALVGILAGADVVLSNDSGVMHLAAALERPTVGIFGSTSPVWTSADAPWVRNLYAAYPCSPCFRRTCPIGYGCLRSIEATDVSRAAVAVMGRE
ncbi:MAG TPA: lipopolysaccharide heptosyltransferase II [Candidatus Eisenbacteria bacterium]|nr:lipopolysaccharide heptosyltransferase II [Candidatus Eisenbacteria bacterium]